MENTIISLADAKARLSELADLAASGETVVITKRGKPLAKLFKADTPRKPLDLAILRKLTDEMPSQAEEAGDFMHRFREEARY